MKRRYTVLGVVTALLPNLYAYAGESQASSMAGGSSSSGATTQETSQAANQPTNSATSGQSSGSSSSNSAQATTQNANQGASTPYVKPVGSSTAPVQGAQTYSMPSTAKPVVKNFGTPKKFSSKPVKKTAVTRTYR
ncbi:MAG TPA: hypothetical protein EYN91_11635 [Candidatus Melainabacteria bacterium]|jgi:hypothetical protein|nr:hypothetical protein [Candidatus Melainabacteria bacterium]HIN64465.1 hypothetical protein [Candidatus Obscuribacterales bacterium]